MQAGMFSGLFAALTTEHRMDSIANNLANVNTRGYKRETMAFKDTMTTFAFDEIREPLQNLKSTPLFPEPMNAAMANLADRLKVLEQLRSIKPIAHHYHNYYPSVTQ